MQRNLLNALIAWKNQPVRKPLLIDGARQTGKTYLLQELFGNTFANILRIDFLENPTYKEAFDGSLSPDELVMNIELLTNQAFNPETDLLIFDEIGECERAVTSLKYFAEKAPSYFVAASGSNIGLLNTFPVGKVEQYNLRPLTFQEFIYASNEQALIKAFDSQASTPAVHTKLMDKLTDYFFTGGMPEAVSAWYQFKDSSILERIEKVTKIHADLVEGYRRDFGKYAGKVDATLIESVFNSIPAQLSLVSDESVKRFKFKHVHERKSRYSDFETAIHWLNCCRLALPNYPIEGLPKSPLAAYKKDNMVKLFLFDVGLLNHMLGSSYKEIKQQNYEYKGYVAENFVQQELTAIGVDPSYSWNDARAEIEFILATDEGDIIPVEVKSGKRTRAKSLASYVEKCAPSKTFKLTGTQGSSELEQTHIVMPLYFTQYLPQRW
ncbi:ATP-binding protein [Vibrio vulnificus]|uniref:ATP-binding protein n=1 Tax=Vibrio vulnificus TaxID=672 RepID=UPI0009B677FE|nr:AAA family ATPase [Vibrio vulnificus]EGQ8026601.1 ATP-binding protein [Vibrio vulnificus]EHH0804497.1 ATP-binding protein [Vibrio vulnificus]EHH0848912.1 ATP-binding protein [Vibrio vulnificus]EHH2473200.1 ATP-binding protein [Vibrio vulnificus]EHK8998838.1 ATP-binding protein [Vibrio vulnificus]